MSSMDDPTPEYRNGRERSNLVQAEMLRWFRENVLLVRTIMVLWLFILLGGAALIGWQIARVLNIMF